ncbi:MAG: GNAT family N-acetyltransferase [Clostridiales bacterium]|nr:GNAT family N-acetyltransferase [Clostridiales bacterium]
MPAWTNQDILNVALRQSAVDSGCGPEDFLRADNVVVTSRAHPKARKYLELPLSCDLTSYGGNIVASVEERYRETVSDYINRFPPERCFETPNLHVLNDALQTMGQRICFMAEYFLPDLGALKPLDCPYELRIMGPSDFGPLYTDQWSNALCEKRKELDVLGLGAYDGGELVGFAACSADCEDMWQIGIDVLQGYRRKGIASALTSRLALEILERGKVPFYCAAWSNIKSVRNAVKSGFRPAWVEMTAKSAEQVEKMNAKG